MKQLKRAGLCVLGVAALATIFGTGTASATVLCTSTPIGSHCPNREIVGMTLDASVETSTLWKTGSTTIVTCTGGTLRMVITNEGNTTETVKGTYEPHTKSGCSTTVDQLASGTWEIHHIPDTDNGLLTSSGTETTIQFLGVSCIFKTSNTPVGTITGGTPATIDVNSTIPLSGGGFLCPANAIGSGAYRFTSPSGTLHVVSG